VVDDARPPLFPIFLNLAGRRAVVIGGGEVAERKVGALLEAGARVRVIAPEVSAGLEARQGHASLEVVRRDYRPGDLEGAALAFAATGKAAVNAAVYEEAQAAGVWVNVADDPAHCTFHMPSQLARGPICVAVSTGGDSPALARHLRERLEEVVTPAYGELARLLGRLRPEVMASYASSRERGARWNAVVEDTGVLELLAQGKAMEAEARARHLLGIERKGRG